MGEGGLRSGISFGVFSRCFLGSKMVASSVQNLPIFESNFGVVFWCSCCFRVSFVSFPGLCGALFGGLKSGKMSTVSRENPFFINADLSFLEAPNGSLGFI